MSNNSDTGFVKQLQEKLPEILEQVKSWFTSSIKKTTGSLSAVATTAKPTKISEKGLELLTQWEGFKTKLYRDSGGNLTIGVGHLITRSERSSGKIYIKGVPVRYSQGLTHQQIIDLLSQDAEKAEIAVQAIKTPLTQNQFDALVSFAFNVGVPAFNKSTMMKRLKAGALQDIPAQFRRWVYAGGRKVRGLVNRRENEIKLWNGQI